MSLEFELLSDYGSIPQLIAMSLLKRNASSFESILYNINNNKCGGIAKNIISSEQLRDGLSILIQRRLVKFFIFEKNVKYFIERKNIKRRLYFASYMDFVSTDYTKEHSDYFFNILIRGIYKEYDNNQYADDLLRDGLIQADINNGKNDTNSNGLEDNDRNNKFRKLSTFYYIVNYDYLDQRIFELETGKYIRNRLNEAAADVFQAVLKCTRMLGDNTNPDKLSFRDQIINNLTSSKILIKEKEMMINEKDNIDEYLKYLCGCNILCKGAGEKREYFFDTSTKKLKNYKINLMIERPECRRIFNMINSKHEVEDKALTVGALLSINVIKQAVFRLQKAGLIIQKCKDEYRMGSRVEHIWVLDYEFLSQNVLRMLEERIKENIKNYNECWDVNYFMNNADGNESIWISDFIGMGIDHLIFGMD